MRSFQHLTIVTNAVNMAMELSKRSDLEVLVIGGFLLTWLMHDLRKKGNVSKIAPYLALIVPSFLPIFFAALSTIPALWPVAHGFSTFFSSLKG